MTTPKYAPGPWKRGGRLQCAHVFDSNDRLIATVQGAHEGGRYSKGSNARKRHEEAMANRRLIAAAPEMLELLKLCRIYVGLEEREQLEAFIAKVEGK